MSSSGSLRSLSIQHVPCHFLVWQSPHVLVCIIVRLLLLLEGFDLGFAWRRGICAVYDAAWHVLFSVGIFEILRSQSLLGSFTEVSWLPQCACWWWLVIYSFWMFCQACEGYCRLRLHLRFVNYFSWMKNNYDGAQCCFFITMRPLLWCHRYLVVRRS